MKKKKVVGIILGVVLLLIMGIIFIVWSNDSLRFKFSYEYINYVEYNNGKKIEVSIPYNNSIKYLKKDKILELVESGTGILYLGYNTCPWCRRMLPVLLDVASDKDMDIFYVDTKGKDFNRVSKSFYKVMDEYLSVKDDGTKGLSVPVVYFIKDGKVVNHHVGTVDSYRNAFIKMTDNQRDELYNIYNDMIKEMNDNE